MLDKLCLDFNTNNSSNMYYQIKQSDIDSGKMAWMEGIENLPSSYFNRKDMRTVEPLLDVFAGQNGIGPSKGYMLMAVVFSNCIVEEVNGEFTIDSTDDPVTVNVLVGIETLDDQGQANAGKFKEEGSYLILSCPPFVDRIGERLVRVREE